MTIDEDEDESHMIRLVGVGGVIGVLGGAGREVGR